MIEVAAPRVAPAEPTTPIRPSEALRLGRLIRPRRLEGEALDGEDGACAVGAIYAGGGGFSWGNSRVADCPVRYPRLRWWTKPCGDRSSIFGTTAHLNDDHHWSDARIVAWLESLGL